MEHNMKMTLQEVEDARGKMNVAVAEAVMEFEKTTCIRTSYIDVIRSKDKEEREGKISHPCEYDEDRGDVAAVTVNLRMEL